MNFQHLTQTADLIFDGGQNNDGNDGKSGRARERERAREEEKNYPVVILIKTTSVDNFTPILFFSFLPIAFHLW